MSVDAYPFYLLRGRLIYVALSFIAMAIIVDILFFRIFNPKWLILEEVALVVISISLEYAQRKFYDKNHIEKGLLAGGFKATGLNAVPKFRNFLAEANTAIIIFSAVIPFYYN